MLVVHRYLGTEQLNMIDFLFFQSLENLVIVILIKVYTSQQVLFNIVGKSNSKLLITSIEVKLSRMADLDEILRAVFRVLIRLSCTMYRH